MLLDPKLGFRNSNIALRKLPHTTPADISQMVCKPDLFIHLYSVFSCLYNLSRASATLLLSHSSSSSTIQDPAPSSATLCLTGAQISFGWYMPS
jgi:hypothetical protein